MTVEELLAEIERISELRNEAWRAGDPIAAGHASGHLEELYGDLRTERARALHGDRKTIVRRARIEVELEKLIGTS